MKIKYLFTVSLLLSLIYLISCDVKKESVGLFPVFVQNGKHGYINKKGDIVINPQFDFALPFSEGLAPVKLAEKLGYIDKTGKYVINPQFDEAFGHAEGLAAVYNLGDGWGYINKKGDIVINPQFYFAHPFSEGLASVCVGGKKEG